METNQLRCWAEINLDALENNMHLIRSKTNPNAKRFDSVSFHEVLNKDLAVMDSTAASLCKDNNIPILVFSIDDPDNIYKAAMGEPNLGTLVDKID